MGEQIAFLDFYVHNNEVWFIDFFSGELCRYSLIQQTVHSVVCLPNVSNKENYRGIYLANDKVYIAPLFADDLIIYDINSSYLETKSLRRSIRKEKPNYLEIIKYNDFLYLLPMDAKSIVRVDTKNDQIEYFDIALQENDGEVVSDRHYFTRGCILNDMIYLPSGRQKKVLCFELNTGLYRWIDIQDDSINGFRSCSYSEGYFVLVTYEGNRAILLTDNFTISSSLMLKETSVNSVDISLHDKVFHIGCESGGIVEIINVSKNLIIPHVFDLGRDNFLPTNNFIFAAKLNKDELWLFSSYKHAICIFDKFGKQIWQYDIRVNKDCKKMLFVGRTKKLFDTFRYEGKKIIQETSITPLSVFLGTLICEGED